MGQVDLITATDIANVRRHLGSGTTFPVVQNTGDTFLHTTLGLHVYNGFIWAQAETVRMTSTQRIALATTQLYDGFRVYETDTDRTWTWTGAAWTLTSVPSVVPDPAWIPATYVNGWSDYDATYAGARYRKLSNGLVAIEGLVKGGTGVIFNLPVGYRPNKQLLIAVQTNSNTIGRMDIGTTGDVMFTTGSNVWFSVHTSFYPDQ